MWLTASSSTDRKVLIVAPQPFFSSRGTPLNVRSMANRLVELGYDVHLLVLPYGDEIQLRGVTIHRCLRIPGIQSIKIGFSWGKALYDFLLLWHAFALSLFHRFTIFHGVEEGGVIVGLLSYVYRKPYIFDLDSNMIEQLRQTSVGRSDLAIRLIERIEKFFLERATAVTTVCASLTRKALSFVPQARIFQVEDAPCSESAIINEDLLGQFRRELDLKGEKVILYTGNFEPYQGIGFLLESFRQLLALTEEKYVLLLAGGTKEQIALESSKARALGILPENIRFMGSLPLSAMGSLMALAHVLVSPRTLGTNTPLKIYTYMAAERPIVATKIESHTQVLGSDCAFLAELDPEAFASTILLACDGSTDGTRRRNALVRNAKQMAETRFSVDAFNLGIQHLYNYALGPLALTPPFCESSAFSLLDSESKMARAAKQD